MRIPVYSLLLAVCSAALLNSCSSEKEDLKILATTDFYTLQKGKYIIYQTDSLVFTQAGRSEEIHSYQEKHLVDEQISDNLGRPAYRIFRQLRDLAGQQPWRQAGSYFITPLPGTLEMVEDNLRVVKLVSPVKEGTTWKGNRFLSNEPYAQKFNFSNDDGMGDWDFIVDSTAKSVVLKGRKIDGVTSISSVDEALNAPVRDASSYAARTLYREQYAVGIGLVFQEYIMWEYQPNSGGTAYKVGFGITRSMIDHN